MHNYIWNQCLEIIKNHVPPDSFLRWFKPLLPIKVENKVLTLQVPSPYYYEWIEEHYLPVLRQALHQSMGKAGKLEYAIEQHELKADQASTTALTQEPASSYATTNTMGVPVGSPLNARYVFDSFVEVDCNKLAYRSAQSAAEQPGHTAFNPLMIYGKVGLGKTHLLQALAHKIQALNSTLQVICLSGEQFLSQFVQALRAKRIEAFCNHFMQSDVLLLDDVQFLAGKEKTQEFFFHIFNHLHQSNKQLVFTSDLPPAELNGLHERLISRLRWGLTVELGRPDAAARESILRAKAAAQGIDLSDEIFSYLANHIQNNVRELEGTLISILAHATFEKTTLTLEAVQKIVNRIVRSVPLQVGLEHIHQIAADYFQLPSEALVSTTRKKEVVIARQVAIHLSKHYTQLGLQAIGNYFGNRDHSTILYALKTIQAKKTKDKTLNKQLQDLHAQIQSRSAF